MQSLSFLICEVMEVNLFVSVILMRLDHLYDFEFQGRPPDLSFEIYCVFSSEHGLKVIWLPKLGVGETSWLQKPI